MVKDISFTNLNRIR